MEEGNAGHEHATAIKGKKPLIAMGMESKI